MLSIKYCYLRNSQVFENYYTPPVKTWGDVNGVAENTLEKTWSFDPATDLSGVSIVAQAKLWGCYGVDAPPGTLSTDPNAHTLHIARNSVQVFNENELRFLAPQPLAPDNLALSVVASSPLLTWDEVSDNIDNYQILRKNRGIMVPIATVYSPSYIDHSVITNNPNLQHQTFTYAVRSVKCGEYSPLSNIVTIQGHTYY